MADVRRKWLTQREETDGSDISTDGNRTLAVLLHVERLEPQQMGVTIDCVRIDNAVKNGKMEYN